MVRLHRLRGYDEATGLVYEETQVPVTSMVSAWPTKCNGRRQRPRDYRHHNAGASSLYDTAMRSCAWHIDLFTPSDLQCAEWHFAEKIYDYLQKHQNLTANAWSLFQQAFPGEQELNHTYPIRIPALHGEGAVELTSIQQWLQLLPFAHLSLLNIQSIRLSIIHLISLIDLPNLGVLLIRLPHDNLRDLDNKAMRDWSRAAQEKSAFTKLRVVGLHGFSASLQATLKSLATFPALQLCTVEPLDPTPSVQYASDQIRKMSLPFRLSPTATSGGDDDPESIWSHGNLSGHVKMKMLYDLAGRLIPQQNSTESLSPAILSVYYGAERHFAYTRYPLWFERLIGVEQGQLISQVSKRLQDVEGDSGPERGEGKKRKIREGKKTDIGSLLGGFG